MSGHNRLRVVYELVYPLIGDDERLLDAFDLADFAHSGQTRATATGRTPYLLHPLRVFFRLQSWGVTDKVTLIAALLHDVVEDAPEKVIEHLGYTPQSDDIRHEALMAISLHFGPSVATVLDGLTNRPGIPYVDHVTDAVTDPRVLAGKLADFSDNALSLDPALPRYEKLLAKYVPLCPVLADALRDSEAAQALIPLWREVLASLRLPA